jgi:hypothetical protein
MVRTRTFSILSKYLDRRVHCKISLKQFALEMEECRQAEIRRNFTKRWRAYERQRKEKEARTGLDRMETLWVEFMSRPDYFPPNPVPQSSMMMWLGASCEIASEVQGEADEERLED